MLREIPVPPDFTVQLISDWEWEYNEPVYYRVLRKQKVVIPRYFIGVTPESISTRQVGDIVYGHEKYDDRIVLFLFRTSDLDTWPAGEGSGEQLLQRLREISGRPDLKLYGN